MAVVEEQVRATGLLREAGDLAQPLLELGLAVVVVVAVAAGARATSRRRAQEVPRRRAIPAPPVPRVAAVEADVGVFRREHGHGREQPRERRLVHSAIADAVRAQRGFELGREPGFVAEFDEQGLVGEQAAHGLQVPAVRVRPLEAPGKLGEQAVVFLRAFERLEHGQEVAVDGGVPGRLMRHRLVELDDEVKPVRSLPLHLLENAGMRDAVVGGVHLHRVEMPGVEGEEVAGAGVLRIEGTDPVGEGVARGTDQNAMIAARGPGLGTHGGSSESEARTAARPGRPGAAPCRTPGLEEGLAPAGSLPKGTWASLLRWTSVPSGTTLASPRRSRTRSSASRRRSERSSPGNSSDWVASPERESWETLTPRRRTAAPFQFAWNSSRATGKIRSASAVKSGSTRWRRTVTKRWSRSLRVTVRPT